MLAPSLGIGKPSKDGPSSWREQLFGYSAWRDTQLAVVMFVWERVVTNIVETAREALADHERFVEWRDGANETELRAVMGWPGDERRHADLNVLFVPVPTDEP